MNISVIASYTVGDFSVGRLKQVTEEDVRQRYEEFRQLTYFATDES